MRGAEPGEPTLRLSAQDMAAAAASLQDDPASPGTIEGLQDPPDSLDGGDIEATQRLAMDDIQPETPSEELGATRRLDVASLQEEMPAEPSSDPPQGSAEPSPMTEEPGGTAKLTAVPPPVPAPRPKRPPTRPPTATGRRPPAPAPNQPLPPLSFFANRRCHSDPPT